MLQQFRLLLLGQAQQMYRLKVKLLLFKEVQRGITASYTGTSVTGTSDAITVNPITLTKIKITGDDVTKVYEGNKTLTNPAFTYAITEGIINSDPVTVEPTTVEYAEADVHTSEPLNITGFHLTNNNDGNYKLGTLM